MTNQRRDLWIQDGKMVVHPEKLRSMKERIRARMTPNGLAALRDSVIDEELECFVEELVVDEIADEMRVQVRAQLQGMIKC